MNADGHEIATRAFLSQFHGWPMTPRAEGKDERCRLCPDKTVTDVAIIGAGPYGLSIAAHLKARGIPFRIFGKAMHAWLAHMPKGMRLKSEGFASGLYYPDSTFTLAKRSARCRFTSGCALRRQRSGMEK